MPRTFDIRGGFDPGWSPLGRWLRRATGDPLRAEAWHLVAGTGGVLALIVVHTLAWTLLGPEAGWLWLLTGGLGMAFALVALAGRRPPARVRLDARGVEVERAGDVLRLPLGAIEDVRTVEAVEHHRHWRRYAATRAFVGPPERTHVLLRTARGPVVLGLHPADQQTFVARLGALRASRAPVLGAVG